MTYCVRIPHSYTTQYYVKLRKTVDQSSYDNSISVVKGEVKGHARVNMFTLCHIA